MYWSLSISLWSPDHSSPHHLLDTTSSGHHDKMSPWWSLARKFCSIGSVNYRTTHATIKTTVSYFRISKLTDNYWKCRVYIQCVLNNVSKTVKFLKHYSILMSTFVLSVLLCYIVTICAWNSNYLRWLGFSPSALQGYIWTHHKMCQ